MPDRIDGVKVDSRAVWRQSASFKVEVAMDRDLTNFAPIGQSVLLEESVSIPRRIKTNPLQLHELQITFLICLIILPLLDTLQV